MLSFKHVMNFLLCALKVQKNKLIIKTSPDTKLRCSFLRSFKGCFEWHSVFYHNIFSCTSKKEWVFCGICIMQVLKRVLGRQDTMLTSFSFSLVIIVGFKESSAASAGGLLPVLEKKYRTQSISYWGPWKYLCFKQQLEVWT